MKELERTVFNHWLKVVYRLHDELGYTELEARDLADKECIELFGEKIAKEVVNYITPMRP